MRRRIAKPAGSRIESGVNGTNPSLIAFYERLEEAFGEDGSVWLEAENRYLGFRPVDALRASRVDLVEATLEALDAGFIRTR